MFTALRRHDAPVEFVLYPNESHTLGKPRHRYSSMERNLDWFNFWLQDRQDDDPAKRGQYARWRQLRRLLDRHVSRTGDCGDRSNRLPMAAQDPSRTHGTCPEVGPPGS